MGCVSSKMVRKELERDILRGANGDYGCAKSHVVSLTSTTYGALELGEHRKQQKQAELENKKKEEEEEEKKVDVQKTETVRLSSHSPPPRGKDEGGEEKAEVINAWELMGDLEEELVPGSVRDKKSPNSISNQAGRSPFKRLSSQRVSPKTVKKLTQGKENTAAPGNRNNRGGGKVSYFTPKGAIKTTCNMEKSKSSDSPSASRRRRRSLSPALFDPEPSEEEEQIKKIISETPTTIISTPNTTQKFTPSTCASENPHLVERFQKRCPPGGENSVVFYSTTLRGIRKTFEECNAVRSTLEAHSLRFFERDVSMDSGFKEELRKLMGTKEFWVPLVFVKGRLIGGVEEVCRMEEEGKLGALFDGIDRTQLGAVCEGCGGMRFVMCTECNGSCKVFGVAPEKKMKVRCGECNENGLIQCPVCC